MRTAMSLQARELYRKPNGDRWFLIRESRTGELLINHRPNAASGARSSVVPIGEFLYYGGDGEEHRALLHLIGSLLDDPADSARPLRRRGTGKGRLVGTGASP
jgi:hypothetical protein